MFFNPYTNNEKLTQTYIWATILGGGTIYFLAAYWLDTKIVDLRFVLIAALTLFLS